MHVEYLSVIMNVSVLTNMHVRSCLQTHCFIIQNFPTQIFILVGKKAKKKKAVTK